MELDDELQVSHNSGQRLSKLTVGRLTGYGSHLRFDEIKVAVVEEVLTLCGEHRAMAGGHIKGPPVRQLCKREDAVTLPPVLLRTVLTMAQPPKLAATKNGEAIIGIAL